MSILGVKATTMTKTRANRGKSSAQKREHISSSFSLHVSLKYLIKYEITLLLLQLFRSIA